MFSAANGMLPAPPPAELVSLNDFEQLLISRIHTVISVVKWKHSGQRMLKGSTTHVPLNSAAIFSELPVNPQNLPLLIIQEKDGKAHAGLIDVDKVRTALVWLKTNNPAYEDVVISESNLLHYTNVNEIQLPNINLRHDGTLASESGESSDDETSNMALRTLDAESDSSDTSEQNARESDARPIQDSIHVPTIVCGEDISRQHPWFQAGQLAASGAGQAMPEQFNAVEWFPAEYQKPIVDANLTSTPGFLCMAFPMLFSTGAADFTLESNGSVPNLREFVNHCIWWSPRQPGETGIFSEPWPFQAHRTFILWSYDVVRRQSMLKAASWVSSSAVEEVTGSTTGDVADSIKTHMISSVKMALRGIPGTAEFMKQQRVDLEATVEQRGIPTLFFTLSAADLRWPSYLMQLNNGVLPVGPERQHVVNRSPASADALFRMRVESFLHRWLYGQLKAEWVWVRYEWQNRGAPHVHGVAKLSDAPDLQRLGRVVMLGKFAAHALLHEELATASRQDKLKCLIKDGEEAEMVITLYGDSIISTCHDPVDLPDGYHPSEHFARTHGNRQQDVSECVSSFQRHSKHTKTCLRISAEDGSSICRFNFPKPIVEQSRLDITKQPGIDPSELPMNIAESVPELSSIPSFHASFVSKRTDPLVNNYNPDMIATWRANMDIKLVIDTLLMIAYITKYTTKAERSSTSFDELFQAVVAAKTADLNSAAELSEALIKRLTRSIAGSMLIQLSSPRDVSVQEAARLLSAVPIVVSPFSYENLSLTQSLITSLKII